jgi:hypothetical protein
MKDVTLLQQKNGGDVDNVDNDADISEEMNE